MPHALIPLRDLGRQQAIDLAGLLPGTPGGVLASPFLRAVDTARPYADHVGQVVELEPLLQEFDMIDPALIAGMDRVQRRPMAERFWEEADLDQCMGHQAESFRCFAGRVTSFLTDLLPTLPARTVCFGHGIWMAMATWQVLGFNTADSQSMRAFRKFQLGFPLPNGVVYRLVELTPGAWSLQAGLSIKEC